MNKNLLFGVFLAAAIPFVSACMGIDADQSGEAPRSAAVRSGLDLMSQLTRATGLDLSNDSVRGGIAGKLGLAGGTQASDVLVGIQIAVGAEDPRAPKLPSSLNMSFRIAYVFGEVAAGLTPPTKVFANTPVTVAPTATTLNAFLKQAAPYFGAEPLGDADRTTLVDALLAASTGRTPKQAWAAAFAVVAVAPGADTL